MNNMDSQAKEADTGNGLPPNDPAGHQNDSIRSLRVVITGGGTGGHLFPGIAIAEAFIEKNPENKILFVNTGKPFEVSVITKAGFDLKKITAEGIKGKGIWQKVRATFKIPTGIIEAICIIRNFKPDLVLGIGSYSSGPMIMAAWFLGLKIILHEQNIMPGITTRLLGHLANRIFVSFKNTSTKLNVKKVKVTGNPVRKDILECADETDTQKNKLFTILVLGGSQGAHSINMAIIDTMKYLKDKEKYFFIHQTGTFDDTMVKDAYMCNSISCVVSSFFNDMAKQYKKADLIICRAGATTIAEVSAIGKFVIFVPYPFATDNHQALNAQAFVEAGASEMILDNELNGNDLAGKFDYYNSHPEVIERMASKSKSLGRPDAAKIIVDDCYAMLGD